MRRREFIAGLGSTVACPLTARGQTAEKTRTVGYLGANSAASMARWTAAFVQRLRDLGWVEGRNLVIEYRWAEGQFNRSERMINEFVHRPVDVIVTHGTGNIAIAEKATSTIPIVFAIAGDPVGNGLIESLARPGGNVTGLSIQTPEAAGKRLVLLRDIDPAATRLAFLANPGNPITALTLREVRSAASKLAIEVDVSTVARREDLAAAIDAAQGRVGALYVPTDPLLTTHREQIARLAIAARLSTINESRAYAEAGGLLSYGPSIPDMFKRAADYVDRILRGANPGELPVEEPTKYELVINSKTAKALHLEVPDILLTTADEVIE